MKFDYLGDNFERSLAPFFSPRMLSVTFRSILILGVLLLVFWPRKEFFLYIEGHELPMIFFHVFVAALLISSYVNLRCGRGEIYTERFFYKLENREAVTFEQERDFISYGLAGALLHIIFLLIFLIPILIVPAGMSGVSLQIFILALSIIFVSSLLCRLFGFLVVPFYGRWRWFGYYGTRFFFILFMFGTIYFAPFLNPIITIRHVYLGEESFSGSPVTPYAVFMFAVIVMILLLILANQVIVRRGTMRRWRGT